MVQSDVKTTLGFNIFLSETCQELTMNALLLVETPHPIRPIIRKTLVLDLVVQVSEQEEELQITPSLTPLQGGLATSIHLVSLERLSKLPVQYMLTLDAPSTLDAPCSSICKYAIDVLEITFAVPWTFVYIIRTSCVMTYLYKMHLFSGCLGNNWGRKRESIVGGNGCPEGAISVPGTLGETAVQGRNKWATMSTDERREFLQMYCNNFKTQGKGFTAGGLILKFDFNGLFTHNEI